MIALDFVTVAALRAFDEMRRVDEFAAIRALQRGIGRRGRRFVVMIGGL